MQIAREEVPAAYWSTRSLLPHQPRGDLGVDRSLWDPPGGRCLGNVLVAGSGRGRCRGHDRGARCSDRLLVLACGTLAPRCLERRSRLSVPKGRSPGFAGTEWPSGSRKETASEKNGSDRALLDYDFIDVAPSPVFAWLERAHDRMARCPEVGRRVTILRGIAAADVSAR
jgi:hypothetical protein